FRLANDLLRVQLRGKYDNVVSARNAVEPFLRAWEFEAEIREGLPVITFIFDDVGLVEEDILPGSNGGWLSELESSNDPTNSDNILIIRRIRYPDPPSIILTPEMVLIWTRFKYARLELREPLQSVAYYSLTVVEQSVGG